MVRCGRARDRCIAALCVLGFAAACAGRSQTRGDDDADGGTLGDAATGGSASGGTSSGGKSSTGGQPFAGRGGSGLGGASGATSRGGTGGVITSSGGVPGAAGADGGEPAAEGGASSGSAGSSGESGAASASAGEGGMPGCDGDCACEGWFADCDHAPGCEPLDGPENCGSCNLPGIVYEHAQMVCTSPTGTYPICEPGFGDCQLDSFDCEASYSDAQRSCLPAYLGSLLLDPMISVSAVQLTAGGAIYLAGTVHGSADFDPGLDTDVISASTHYSAFVTKLGADGSYEWTRAFSGIDGASAWGDDLAIGPDGRVLLLGTAEGSHDAESSADLDPPKLAFVVALSGDGEQRWYSTLESARGSAGSRISIGEAHEVYVLTKIAPDGPGYQGALLTKLDSEGQALWSRAGDSDRSVFGAGVVATTQGVVMSLGLNASCQLQGFAEPLASANPTRAAGLLASFTADGNATASGFFEGEDSRSTATTYRVLRAANGALFVAGTFEGKVDLDPGPATSSHGLAAENQSTFVTRLTEDGAFVWAQAMPSFELGDMAVAEDGHVFLSGHALNGTTSEIRAFSPNLRSQFTLPLGVTVWHLAANTQQLVVVGYASAGADIDPTDGVELTTQARPFVVQLALNTN